MPVPAGNSVADDVINDAQPQLSAGDPAQPLHGLLEAAQRGEQPQRLLVHGFPFRCKPETLAAAFAQAHAQAALQLADGPTDGGGVFIERPLSVGDAIGFHHGEKNLQ